MFPKKKIVELSKKKFESELKKQKDVLKDRNPIEKAKSAYYETGEKTSPAKDSKDFKRSESAQEQESTETTPEEYTADLSKLVSKSYDQLQRTGRGIAAAATVLLGETLGIDTSDDSEKSAPQTDGTKTDVASLARKILEQKKREKSD